MTEILHPVYQESYQIKVAKVQESVMNNPRIKEDDKLEKVLKEEKKVYSEILEKWQQSQRYFESLFNFQISKLTETSLHSLNKIYRMRKLLEDVRLQYIGKYFVEPAESSQGS